MDSCVGGFCWTESDVFWAVVVACSIVGLVLCAEFLTRALGVSRFASRKFNHLAVIPSSHVLVTLGPVGHVVFVLNRFSSPYVAAAVPAAFVIGNLLVSPSSPIKLPLISLASFEGGDLLGPALYPLSLSIICLVALPKGMWFAAAVFLPLVYGDSAAALLGRQSHSSLRFQAPAGIKSFPGVAGFLVFAMLGTQLGLRYIGVEPAAAVALSTAGALVGALIELFSPKGMDNLTIPVGLYVFHHYFIPVVVDSRIFHWWEHTHTKTLRTFMIIFGVITLMSNSRRKRAQGRVMAARAAETSSRPQVAIQKATSVSASASGQ
eukprot:gene2875-3465_t